MNPSVYEAIKELQEANLVFPAFETAFDQIKDNLKLFRQTGAAQHLLVMGESGTGKSTLARLFAERYPKEVLPERDVLPVLKVDVPAAATIAGTVEAVLACLGDPMPERGTVSVKTARAVRIARGCGVEMLLFDEAQHIHDRGRVYSQYFVGDWLKSFMDALALPVTLLGLPRTEALLQVNEQLRRRFTHRLSLAFHQNRADSNTDDSLALFHGLAQNMKVPFRPSPYSWNELSERLYYATDGRISYVKQLLIAAYRQALILETQEITPQDLEDAFTRSIWPAGVGALNPFNHDFPFRRLDRAAEPFQSGEITGSVSRRKK